MKNFKKFFKALSILIVVGFMLLPADFAFASGTDRPLTDRENAAFIVRDEWTAWVKGFTASLSELDKNATSRIYDNMDFYDMQYRFTEKYKKVPEYLDEDGKPTQKLKDLIKQKRKEINGAQVRDYLCFTSKENGSTVAYTLTGLSASAVDIGISYDGTSFTPWNGSAITLDSGKSVYILNKKNTLSTSTSNYLKFVLTGNIEGSGSVDSMINFSNITSYCFANMFNGQTALKVAPELPATTLANSCYCRMFQGSGILAAPELPATTLAQSCYSEMFQACASLESGPSVLPAASVPASAYYVMFHSCGSLKNAPVILATSVGDNSCANMFQACSSLETAPELLATTLGSGCYSNMFTNCTSLKNAPSVLPAKTLVSTCYQAMFNGCNQMQVAPYIKATTIQSGSIGGMFAGCSSLIEVALDYTGAIDSKFSSWLSSAASNGNLYYSGPTPGTPEISIIGLNGKNWTIINNNRDYLTFKALEDNATVKFTGITKNNVYYLTGDTYKWTKLNVNDTITFNTGETVKIWNRDTTWSTGFSSLATFATSKKIECSGNVNSLINFSSTLSDYCYRQLFKGSSITTAPTLPSMTLKQMCYREMFYDCRNLTIAPELPATTLSLQCYDEMFFNCYELVTAPPTLPATSLANQCYLQMFKNCNKLEIAPDILATSVAVSQAMYEMFYGCASLKSIKIYYTGAFSGISGNPFDTWVGGVANTGTFYYNGIYDTTFGSSAIPKNSTNKWTVLPFTDTDWTSVAASDWMGKVPNSRYLNNINIPGTHDSSMTYLYSSNPLAMAGIEYARTQDNTITSQLEKGARLLDIRIDGSDTTGVLCHGDGSMKFVAKDTIDSDESATLTFSSVFEYSIKGFLDSHTNETIIMSVKVEDGDAANVVTAINDVITANPDYFYTGTTIPQLKDVRKKIVILSRIPSLGSGISLSLPDKVGGNITIDGVTFYAEDHYDVNADTKKTHIDTAFNATTAHDVKKDGTKGTNGGLIFTSSNVVLTATPRNISNSVNPYIVAKTFTQGKQLGWILSDFAEDNIIQKVYKTNP